MTKVDWDRLIEAAPNVVRLDDYRRPPAPDIAAADFATNLNAIAAMFLAQRAAERAGMPSPAGAP